MAVDSRSSSSGATPAWARVAMPSVADLIFIALLGALVFTPLTMRLLGDAGIGWHIRTGQQILATRAVPRVDSFSSTMAGKPWYAWEWLYDLVVGALESVLGLNGVVWLTAVVIAVVYAGMFRWLIARGTNLLVSLLLTLLAVSASMIHFLARPHVVSWLFTLAWFVVLDSSERDCFNGRGGLSRRQLWLLPLLMLVWVNLHGGFLVGFVLLVVFWLSAMWSWFAANENRIEQSLRKIAAGKRARELAWVALLSAAVSLVNPYGWKLHEHIYGYLSNRFLMDHIEEFQSPNFHGIAQRCFLVLLLIAIGGLAVRRRELPFSHGLTVLFAIYAGLYASRNIPVSAVLLALVVGPLLRRSDSAALRSSGLPGAVLSEGFMERMAAIEIGQRWHVWPAVAVVATLLVAVNGGQIGSIKLMDAHFSSKRMPVEAVNYLQKNPARGPVLVPDYWGGYLIYRLYPRTQVVVDDRHDLYGEEFFKSYLKLMHVEAGWENFLRDHPAGCVLLPKESALANRLIASSEWSAIYVDADTVAFVVGPGKQ